VDGSSITTDANSIPTAALVQKYLTVIDLTSNESTDTIDQSTMLAALIERFKGISKMVSNCVAIEKPTGQGPAPSVVRLYAW
jgi:mediator of RNA polymerase II transcription subunit 12